MNDDFYDSNTISSIKSTCYAMVSNYNLGPSSVCGVWPYYLLGDVQEEADQMWLNARIILGVAAGILLIGLCATLVTSPILPATDS
eukprot:NODE_19090_length_860_cov_5.652115.p3 GENE.NODE_19090_length_860_cov_5.652115~~NODE_19090_length_860_cov_5.652115.p3  ORF type:complete len:86 (+),score=14.08 NODE_19090_length_860_cov_5.652115:528-785(+)